MHIKQLRSPLNYGEINRLQINRMLGFYQSYSQTVNERNYKTAHTPLHKLSTTSIAMCDVELLLVPVGEQKAPVLRANDQVFLYDQSGLHVIPDVRKYLCTYCTINNYIFFLLNCTERVSA